MYRLRALSLAFLILMASVGAFATLPGCDSGTGVSDAPLSPEAKKADEALRDGMKEFMTKKGKEKPKPGR